MYVCMLYVCTYVVLWNCFTERYATATSLFSREFSLPAVLARLFREPPPSLASVEVPARDDKASSEADLAKYAATGSVQ